MKIKREKRRKKGGREARREGKRKEKERERGKKKRRKEGKKKEDNNHWVSKAKYIPDCFPSSI